MKHQLPAKTPFTLLFFLLFSVSSFAQLTNFTLTVTPTPQTCLGNGSLAFVVTGTTPGASIDYNVYLLPNTTTPVTTVTTNSASGLSAGNYLVVATQSLGGQSSTSSANVTIANNVQALAYTLTPTNVRCGTDGKITVNVTSGTAVSYEITSGPVTAPVQTSNIFSNLPIGSYQVRVYDNCGEAVVVSIQLIQLTTSITIDPVDFPGGELPSCTTIDISHHYFCPSNQDIFFPLTFQYTITPPGGGAPVIVTQIVPGGGDDNEITSIIPFYYNQQYSYNLLITDACGNTFTRNNNIVNQALSLSATPTYPNCTDQSFTIAPNNYFGQYTLNFTAMPAGFIPANFNSSYPTYNGPQAVFGGEGNSVPDGNYTVTILDSCGHTATVSFEMSPPELSPSIVATAVCGSETGTVSITIPNRSVAAVVITAAPATYTAALPQDVSSYINAFGGFEMGNLPIGTYTFFITDTCGDTYTEVVVLQPTGGGGDLTVINRPGCAIGEGSIRLAASGPLVTVIITAAPSAFTETLPYDVSSYIVTTGLPANIGKFFMGSLPAGTYTFHTVDACNNVKDQQVTVTGYAVTQNDFTVIPHCGSFDLNVQHVSNGINAVSFWLQEYNTVTGTWGHPATGVAYPDGTLPTNTNSYMLTNNSININLQFTGQFRVLKFFYTYGNGTATQTRCMQELYDFTFDGGPVINNAFGFPCASGLTEVVIDATGVAPLTYSITTMNGVPFIVDNGTSNLFSGLAAATYNFQVTDVCGNIRNIQFDINTLDPVEVVPTGFCEGEASSLSIQEFSFLSYQWYEQGSPTTILSNTGTLSFPAFNSATDAGTYVLVITSTNPNSCLNQTIEYIVAPNAIPNAGADDSIVLCNEGNVLDLATYLATPHDAGGTWTDVNGTGALAGSMLDTSAVTAGTYQFKYTVNGLCSLADDATITIQLKEIPAAPVLAPVAAVCEGNDVQLTATAVTGATYQWTGPNGFTSAVQSPLITSASTAATGTYTLIATLNGCPSPAATVAVTVKPVPQFTIEGNTQLCSGQTTVLSVVPGNFTPGQVTYAWYFEGDLQQDVTDGDVQVSETGTYVVAVTNNGCTSTREITVVPNTNAFTVTLEGGCVNEQYVIKVLNQDELPGAQYSWTGPANFSFTGPEATITNLATGDYSVVVTNADGCSANATLTVDNTSCIIPRGISPNADGMNDSFDLSNLEVQHLEIFNRYGLQVYEKDGYLDEWKGQSDKGDLVTGTYFYVITLSAGKKVTGWVYLQKEIH